MTDLGGVGVKLETKEPHFVSLGGGRLSVGVSIIPIKKGMFLITTISLKHTPNNSAWIFNCVQILDIDCVHNSILFSFIIINSRFMFFILKVLQELVAEGKVMKLIFWFVGKESLSMFPLIRNLFELTLI